VTAPHKPKPEPEEPLPVNITLSISVSGPEDVDRIARILRDGFGTAVGTDIVVGDQRYVRTLPDATANAATEPPVEPPAEPPVTEKPKPKRGRKKAAKKAAAKPEPKPEPEPEPSAAPSLDDLRGAVRTYIETHDVGAAKAILETYDAAKLSDVDPARYAELHAELGAAG